MYNIAKTFSERSIFDLTHKRTFSCFPVTLVPSLVMEVVPGDSLRVSTQAIIRLNPLVSPVMHEINVYNHYFFVPSRLLMTAWEAFRTGGNLGTDSTSWAYMTSPGGGYAEGSLADYLGLPTGVAGFTHSALPFRAYNLIYNQWYRNQWLQSELTNSLAAGSDTTSNKDLQNRNWQKDYFTGCLLSPQRGVSAYLPLGTTAPLVRINNAPRSTVKIAGSNTVASDATIATNSSGLYGLVTSESLALDNSNGMQVDLTAATAATIDSIRLAFAGQRFMERNAIGGSRYVEFIYSQFGVRSSDARLQRPEYLGGGKSQIMISEVLKTSTDGSTPQGSMVGHALSAHSGMQFHKSFEEDGFVIGIMSVMPKSQYQQGIHRMWNRQTRYDYYVPAFAHLGRQAVLNKELYAAHTTPEGVFGYQDRYEEMRRTEDSVHGIFRSTPYYTWHCGRILGSSPSLNDTFIKALPAHFNRIFASTTDAPVLVQLVNYVKAARPLPRKGEPGFIDH